LSSTVFHGSSASDWNTKPTSRPMPSTSAPWTATDPSLARSSPDTRVSVVDFPHPLGPTTAQNWPASTVRSTSAIAVKTDPSGVGNRLVTPLSSMAGTRPPLPSAPMPAIVAAGWSRVNGCADISRICA
jgi:hypothetical protein